MSEPFARSRADSDPQAGATARAPAELADRLIDWQRRHGRHDLPWQGTRDPYRVWLSEIMLQQTQVSTVTGYYERFVLAFDSVAALAAAPLDDVLALWSGLGYYSRARNLHRCARLVVDRHGGRFPTTSALLAELPGIGPSTAAAIAAFCFGERCAILDGNVKRVLSRALGFSGDLADAPQQRRLWQLANALLPDDDIAAYTQGLMDLGAGPCSRRRPDCGACPLATLCVARRDDHPEAYPVKTRRLVRSLRSNALLWLTAGDSVWLVRRPEAGIWAGLWTMPEFADAEAVWSLTAGWPGHSEALPAFKHVLTHLDWMLQPCRWALPDALPATRRRVIERLLPAGRWLPVGEALALGLPAPVRRLLEATDAAASAQPA